MQVLFFLLTLFCGGSKARLCSGHFGSSLRSWVWPEVVAAVDTCSLSTGQGRPQLAHQHICSENHDWESEGLREGAYQGLAVRTWRASILARSAGLKVRVSQHTALGLQPLEQHWGEAQWEATMLVRASGMWTTAGYSVHI